MNAVPRVEEPMVRWERLNAADSEVEKAQPGKKGVDR